MATDPTRILNAVAASKKPAPPSLDQFSSADFSDENVLNQYYQELETGNPQAIETDRHVRNFAGNDENAYNSAIIHLANHPDPIDAGNSYQMNKALAEWAGQRMQPMTPAEYGSEALFNLVQTGKPVSYDQMQARRAEESLGMMSKIAKNQQLSRGGNIPASIQIANEIEKARMEGDMQRVADLERVHKIVKLGEGMTMTPDGVTELPGYGETAGGIKKTIEAGGAEGRETGKGKGENIVAYKDFMAAVPSLERTVKRLYSLADAATYTGVGKGRDFFLRQFGANVGNPAEARAEYRNLVRTSILPTLRATFGAQFTVKEGEWLLSTLGSESLSPEEKKAELSARIAEWKNMAETMARRAGEEVPTDIFSDLPPKTESTGWTVKRKN